MIDESRSITLTFGQEELKLWEILQSLEPDQRQRMIIQALTTFFKEFRVPKAESDSHEEDPVAHKEQSSVPKKDSNAPWDLESLFIQPEKNTSTEHELKLLERSKVVPPLKHLFDILGEEEDEEVIKLLSQNHSEKDNEFSDQPPLTEHKKAYVMDELDDAVSIEPQSVGLNFILKNVIGEEEDEDVLQFFGLNGSTKSE